MKKAIVTGLWSLLLATVLTVPAFAQELVVGGQVVGVQISTEGVVVAGFSEIETESGTVSPAQSAGVHQGDLITAVNGSKVADAQEVISAVGECGGESVCLGLQRGGKSMSINVTPAQSGEGEWLLGIWLRDGLSGLGTLTFCDPDSGVFGALGHSVSDSDTGLTIPVREGSITDAQIVSVNPGVSGSPGELNGWADLGKVLGSIEMNTAQGIFGQAYVSMDGRMMETGSIAVGTASIVSTINGRDSREYAIESAPAGDRPGAHRAHGRHRAGHERQPDNPERKARRRGDARVRLRPDKGLRREHTGYAARGGDNEQSCVKVSLRGG